VTLVRGRWELCWKGTLPAHPLELTIIVLGNWQYLLENVERKEIVRGEEKNYAPVVPVEVERRFLRFVVRPKELDLYGKRGEYLKKGLLGKGLRRKRLNWQKACYRRRVETV